MTEKERGWETVDPGANLAWAARRFGEREAVVDGDRRLSFRELDRRSNRVANALLALGLRRGGRVAKLMNNRAEVLELNFGAAKAGAASVHLNARHATPEHVHVLDDSGAEVLFADEPHRGQVPALREACGGLRQVVGLGWEEEGVLPYEGWLARASDRSPGVEVELDDPFALHYTSATTGEAKGVLNTHRTHRAYLRRFLLNVEYRLGPGDSMVHAALLSHAAFNYTESYLVRGARNIILPEFDPEPLLEAVERERATTLFLVPTMIAMLLDAGAPARRDLSSLHTINYGASPISEDLLRRAIAELGPIFRQHYGLTEARQPVALLLPGEHLDARLRPHPARLASCGKPALGVEVALLDEGDQAVERGRVGELCVRGDSVMAGYWKDPAATAEALRGGWLHTGDLATRDEEGYLYLVDRKKDLIISGGFNVYPREVERVLLQHPNVQEAVVFGVPDERWGEAVMALVVPRAGGAVSESEVVEFCRGRIAGYKKPKRVELVEELPKNRLGKVVRRELRARYGPGQPGGGS